MIVSGGATTEALSCPKHLRGGKRTADTKASETIRRLFKRFVIKHIERWMSCFGIITVNTTVEVKY